MPDHAATPLEFDYLDAEEMTARSRSVRDSLARRRSVRDFDSRPVPREVLENAIAAAGSAPSGANMQPWHFVVVTDPEMKATIRQRAEDVERGFYSGRITPEWRVALEPLGLDTSKPFLTEASALIVVFRRIHVIDEGGRAAQDVLPYGVDRHCDGHADRHPAPIRCGDAALHAEPDGLPCRGTRQAADRSRLPGAWRSGTLPRARRCLCSSASRWHGSPRGWGEGSDIYT